MSRFEFRLSEKYIEVFCFPWYGNILTNAIEQCFPSYWHTLNMGLLVRSSFRGILNTRFFTKY